MQPFLGAYTVFFRASERFFLRLVLRGVAQQLQTACSHGQQQGDLNTGVVRAAAQAVYDGDRGEVDCAQRPEQRDAALAIISKLEKFNGC